MHSRSINVAVAENMPVESPAYWRRRAEAARTRAEHALDGITKGLMLEIADSYERIAKAYEELLPTASVCKMSTGTHRRATVVCASMDNGWWCLTRPL
jgi:hypothetical protein